MKYATRCHPSRGPFTLPRARASTCHKSQTVRKTHLRSTPLPPPPPRFARLSSGSSLTTPRHKWHMQRSGNTLAEMAGAATSSARPCA
eukprot:scaffold2742_cov130-Isochrysis_galbana.AAC.9